MAPRRAGPGRGAPRSREDVPYAETRAYVGRVLEMETVYRRAYGGDLGASG